MGKYILGNLIKWVLMVKFIGYPFFFLALLKKKFKMFIRKKKFLALST